MMVPCQPLPRILTALSTLTKKKVSSFFTRALPPIFNSIMLFPESEGVSVMVSHFLDDGSYVIPLGADAMGKVEHVSHIILA